ncbi:MAG: helix-turn-helix domain-containing protein [Chloroflexota bacterium]
MSKTIHINSVSQLHQLTNLPKPRHPKVSVVKQSELRNLSDLVGMKIVTDLYLVIVKKGGCDGFVYGRSSYDFEEGTINFFAPGQVVQINGNLDDETEHKESWKLAFHPDLIRKSELANLIDHFSFFDYDLTEGLHLSEDEKNTIEEILDRIVKESHQLIDNHSQRLIIANIQLLLEYCLRFYDRQFYMRSNINSDIVARFEKLLKEYFKTGKVYDLGVPSVGYCASQLNLSPNYFSDLLKKETGKSAQEHIHSFIIERAKYRLLSSSDSISEIGYALGFTYSSNFSNLFKAKTGMSPRKFRNSS